MKRIEEIFKPHRAKSGLYSQYKSGEVAYIGNGLSNNAVVGYVTPLQDDKVFDFPAIVVSAFCEATVQVPPFVACGRAGNGLTVLEPRAQMPIGALAYTAAYINSAIQWRFNWYRQTTIDRIKHLHIPDKIPKGIAFDVNQAMPKNEKRGRKDWKLKLRPFVLGEIFTIEPGEFHSVGDLAPGTTPVVSCGDLNNGVMGYYDVGTASTFSRLITIAFNGENALTAKYHPYLFAAKDDVAVCIPKQELRPSTELFIQTMVNRERWRYSYYRKCYSEKLRRFEVSLPELDGKIDEDTIQHVVEGAPYWSFIHNWRQSR